MKSKELIRLLMQLDPTGEEEVCVGNADIFSVRMEAAYWDGCLEVLKRDESKPCYNIVGAKVVSSGEKIVIHPLPISDAIWENPRLEVDYSDVYPQKAKYYKKAHDRIRDESVGCEYEIELENFVKHIKERSEPFTQDMKSVEDEAVRFFKANLSPKDPLPWNPFAGESYRSTRLKQWSEQIEIDHSEGKVQIRKKQQNESGMPE